MTGFAREAGTTGPFQWAWEARTVNGRGLDVRVRTPPGYEAVGEAARVLLAKAASRGQCQLSLSVTRLAASSRPRIDRDLLASLLESLADLPRPEAVGPPTMDGLLAVRGVVQLEEDAEERGDDALEGALLAAAGRLIEQLTAARAKEGDALEAALRAQLAQMGRLVEAAETCPGRQPEVIRARLAGQVAALLDASATLDPARLHAEAALLATRADIREELDRLRAHLDAARSLLSGQGAVGRRLDFLSQEFGREANTLCAKANDVELSRIGLDLKAVVDQFREQAQNVE